MVHRVPLCSLPASSRAILGPVGGYLLGAPSGHDLRGAEAFSEHYFITERDTVEAAMQDAARRALSQYCSLFSGVADGLDLNS
jgi:hypothetical protein